MNNNDTILIETTLSIIEKLKTFNNKFYILVTHGNYPSDFIIKNFKEKGYKIRNLPISKIQLYPSVEYKTKISW